MCHMVSIAKKNLKVFKKMCKLYLKTNDSETLLKNNDKVSKLQNELLNKKKKLENMIQYLADAKYEVKATPIEIKVFVNVLDMGEVFFREIEV